MLGYHYTTREGWEAIQDAGHLRPEKIRAHEHTRFSKICKNLPPDAIWVWEEELTDEEAFIALILLAEMHNSFDLVLLELRYPHSSSASIVCIPEPGDRLTLTCEFAVGRLRTGKRPIDLILDPVYANNIKELWQGNLLKAMQGRHRVRRSNSVCA